MPKYFWTNENGDILFKMVVTPKWQVIFLWNLRAGILLDWSFWFDIWKCSLKKCFFLIQTPEDLAVVTIQVKVSLCFSRNSYTHYGQLSVFMIRGVCSREVVYRSKVRVRVPKLAGVQHISSFSSDLKQTDGAISCLLNLNVMIWNYSNWTELRVGTFWRSFCCC